MGLVLAIVLAVVIGLVHTTGHYTFGDEDSFQEAGVTKTGIAVVTAAFIVGLVIPSP